MVRVGATVASLGVLLSVLAGASRTVLAMARRRELPAGLAAVHPRFNVPHRAAMAVGAVALAAVLVADIRQAIGFSSFTLLVYYAIANAAAWTLPARRRVTVLAVGGFVGCAVLAVTLPLESVIGGVGVLVAGALLWVARRRRR